MTGARGPRGPVGTVDTGAFYTKQQADERYLPAGGTAVNATKLGGSAPAAFAASSLFGAPFSTTQASGSSMDCELGEVKLFAGGLVPSNWALLNGQTLPLPADTALFALLGTRYGGDGTTGFKLPDLTTVEPKGNGPAAVNYYICTTGIFP